MNTIKNIIALMLFLFISINASETKNIEKSFPVSPEIGVKITTASGMDVKVKTWDKHEVYLNLSVEISSSDDDYELEYINSFDIISESAGSQLLITIVETDEDYDWNFWDIFRLKFVSYISKDIKGEIFIPRENDFTSDFRYSDISLTNSSGKITLYGKGNNLSLVKCSNLGIIENAFGNIKIENCGGNLELLSRSCENIIKNFDGNVVINSNYSDIISQEIKGTLNIVSRSADISVNGITKSLTIDADHSTIDVYNVGENVKIKDRSGTINLDKVGAIDLNGEFSDFTIQNVSGNNEKLNKIFGRSGSINLLKVSGGLSIKSDYSNMDLDSIKGDVEIDTRSNTITGNNIDGDINLSTEYSSISLLNVISDTANIAGRSENIVLDFINEPKKVSVVCKHGNIDISIPKKYKGGFNIESSYGNIKSDFDFQKEIDKSSKQIRSAKGENNSLITIEGRSGDIEILAK